MSAVSAMSTLRLSSMHLNGCTKLLNVGVQVMLAKRADQADRKSTDCSACEVRRPILRAATQIGRQAPGDPATAVDRVPPKVKGAPPPPETGEAGSAGLHNLL